MANKYQNKTSQNNRKSGAKFQLDKNGKPMVIGWFHKKGVGLVTLLCVPTGNTGTHVSKKGHEWQNWMVKCKHVDALQESTLSGLYNPTNHTVHISDYNMIVKPSTAGGGWVGNPNS